MTKQEYTDAWQAVLYSEGIDLFEARDTAYAWHDGQWSALYSFASTDCTIHDEEHRIQCENDVLRLLDKAHDRDMPALDNLLAAIRALPAKTEPKD